MLRLCHLTWSCSRKPKWFTFCLFMQNSQNFRNGEHGREAVGFISSYSCQLKPWKKVEINNPLITNNRISELAHVMDCDEAVIRKLIFRDSCSVTRKGVLEKIKLLKAHGFSADDIVARPSILHRSLALIKSRLRTVVSMPWPDVISLHAIEQPDSVFEQHIKKHRDAYKVMESFTSREQFFANLFNCDEKTVAFLVASNKLLLSISPALISSKMYTLLKYQIPHEFARENMKICLYTSVRELERRLTLLQEKQVLLPLNAHGNLGYLLSCNSNEFFKSLSCIYKRKEALEGCQNKLNYLCFRLQCSKPAAMYFFSSPRMKRLTETKLKQMLDFLLKEIKMDADFALNHKAMFIYSIKRLRERWTVLCNAGYKDVTLLPCVAALTDKQFSAKYGSCVFVDTFNSPEE